MTKLLTTTTLLFCFLLSYAQNEPVVLEKRINELITKKISMDKDGAFKDRYTIQLFYGELKQANKVKSAYDNLGMDWKSELIYEAPNHKIWVGRYRNRLQADRALLKIKDKYKDAFILKPERD